MASDYLKDKWRLWFHGGDANLDGVLSDADFEACGNTFCELHHLEGDKAKQAKDTIAFWYKTYFFREHAGTGSITEDVFVETLSKDYAKDKAKFKQEIVECQRMIWSVLDNDGDLHISETESEVCCKAFKIGSLEQKAMHEFFQKFNPKDGLVPVKDFENAWIELITNEDRSQEEIIKQALQEGS